MKFRFDKEKSKNKIKILYLIIQPPKMNELFGQEKTKGQFFKIDDSNLRSDGISHIIKCWRLGLSDQVIAMTELLLKKKLITKDYVMQRALIFAYEDGSLETIKTISSALGDYRSTKLKGTKTTDGLWINYDSGEGDSNIFWRVLYLNAVLPKRRETEEGVGRLKSLNNGIQIRKEREKKKQIDLPSYTLDKHCKTGKLLKENGFDLDQRYSGNGYGNTYMELEYQKYGSLKPDRIDLELENVVANMQYKNF